MIKTALRCASTKRDLIIAGKAGMTIANNSLENNIRINDHSPFFFYWIYQRVYKILKINTQKIIVSTFSGM